MHKKLASELISLAHDILTIKNKESVFELKKKAYEVYEKLSVLAYIEEYINNTPQATETKEELIEQFQKSLERKEETKKQAVIEQEEVIKKEETLPKEVAKNEELEEIVTIEQTTTEDNKATEKVSEKLPEEEKEITEVPKEEIIEQPFDELQQLLFDDPAIKDEASFIEETKTNQTLEDELKGTLSVDITANLFEKATTKRSLNDRLQSSIQIGLNDRIAFVKHLFEGSQNDFNRVISQLNTLKTEKEAKSFINRMVKPDYNWSEKEEYETRLMEIIERRFA